MSNVVVYSNHALRAAHDRGSRGELHDPCPELKAPAHLPWRVRLQSLVPTCGRSRGPTAHEESEKGASLLGPSKSLHPLQNHWTTPVKLHSLLNK